MEDSYVFEDSCTFIEDEAGIWPSSDGSVQEHLETLDEPVEPSSEKRSEMSLPRKLWYALESLASWREKARVKQERIRVLEQRVRDLIESRANWKEKAIQAEKQPKGHTASADQAAQTKPSLKQTIISSRE